MHRLERGVPYLWMGGIEDALGFWIPIGLVQPDASPIHGTLDGDLAFYEVDPHVPAMLRRNHDGRRGRSDRTTAWIHLDGVPDMLARVRADLLANDPAPYAKVARLDRFAATFVDDLDIYLREQVAGVSLGCPTESGRQIHVDLVVDPSRGSSPIVAASRSATELRSKRWRATPTANLKPSTDASSGRFE